MAETCLGCHKFSFDYDETKLKRCSGCKKAYYCSEACQDNHWVFHKFDCQPDRINTADRLAMAVYEDMLPGHPQTCEDYGFDRAITPEAQSKLIGLYIGLIKILGIPPRTVHKWRIHGVLVDKIKETYNKVPEAARAEYYPWFLENEHIIALAGQPRTTDMMVRAWIFIEGSDSESREEIIAAIERKPKDVKDCFYLCAIILSKGYPDPAMDMWVDFGFASCTSEDEEKRLCARYYRLIEACTFKEFCDAYRDHRLLSLFRSKGLPVDDGRGHLGGLLGGDWKKSVWFLKQNVVQDPIAEGFGMAPAVMVDYGFFNCETDSERQQLRRAYKAFFDSPHGDPSALHEAAIKGNIHGYLSTVVQGLENPVFRRLMENPYPLPEYDDSD
ncbi:hypothetical protein JVT61DRAFT_7332 [Boletus reticuloceps]|uniref:MYND-type domain-containing protein n=1 Tax=Boletus reticuloceps TaxID=495285 RepID=A0A8I2YIW0_9AGAM|nr:hypothetical protein JVT61DRAFT_7332 [Boletus reticuloceps]